MLTQIKHAEIPTGKVIKASRAFNEEMYIVFNDETFVALRAQPVFDQAVLEDIIVQLDPRKGIHRFDHDQCIELGIITQDEWDDAERCEQVISDANYKEYLTREIARMQEQLKKYE